MSEFFKDNVCKCRTKEDVWNMAFGVMLDMLREAYRDDHIGQDQLDYLQGSCRRQMTVGRDVKESVTVNTSDG